MAPHKKQNMLTWPSLAPMLYMLAKLVSGSRATGSWWKDVGDRTCSETADALQDTELECGKFGVGAVGCTLHTMGGGVPCRKHKPRQVPDTCARRMLMGGWQWKWSCVGCNIKMSVVWKAQLQFSEQWRSLVHHLKPIVLCTPIEIPPRVGRCSVCGHQLFF